MESKSKERTVELDLVNPIEIRGHHLDNFVGIQTNLLWKPSTLKEAQRLAWRLTALYVKKRKGLAENNEWQAKYTRDLLGDTPEQLEEFSWGHMLVLFKYITYPDDYNVKIRIGKSDEFCKACVFGEHCSDSTLTEYDEKVAKKILGQEVVDGTIIKLGDIRRCVRSAATDEILSLMS